MLLKSLAPLVMLVGCTTASEDNAPQPQPSTTTPPTQQAAQTQPSTTTPPTQQAAQLPPVDVVPSEVEQAIQRQPRLPDAERMAFTTGGSLRLSFGSPENRVQATLRQVMGTVELTEGDWSKTRINLAGILRSAEGESSELTELLRSPNGLDPRRFPNIVLATESMAQPSPGQPVQVTAIVALRTKAQRVTFPAAIDVRPDSFHFHASIPLSRAALELPPWTLPGGATVRDPVAVEADFTVARNRR